MSRRFRALVVLLGALAVLAAAGCGPRHGAESAGDRGAPVDVSTFRAAEEAGAALVLPARVAAGEEVVVTARVAGRVTALAHREGDRFRVGDPLVTFEAPEARQTLLAAQAALDAATLRDEQARLQESRIESLFVARVASQRERELAQVARRAAAADLAAARASFTELSSALAIPAPFDGVVVRRMLDPGATVNPGSPILAIRSRGPGEILAAVPESELPRLARARFAVRTADGPWRDATLVRVDGMTDYATRTRVARFRPKGAGAPFEPGAFARVRIESPAVAGSAQAAATPAALRVPAGALVRRGALAGVYVVRDGRAYLRWLRLGTGDGESFEVLSGLDPDDEIVADPAGLSDGIPVRVSR